MIICRARVRVGERNRRGGRWWVGERRVPLYLVVERVCVRLRGRETERESGRETDLSRVFLLYSQYVTERAKE